MVQNYYLDYERRQLISNPNKCMYIDVMNEKIK